MGGISSKELSLPFMKKSFTCHLDGEDCLIPCALRLHLLLVCNHFNIRLTVIQYCDEDNYVKNAATLNVCLDILVDCPQYIFVLTFSVFYFYK